MAKIERLCETKKFAEPFQSVHVGPTVEDIEQKNRDRKSRDMVPLRCDF